MTRKTLSTAVMLCGILLLAGALGLTGYNLWSQQQAGRTAHAALEVLAERVPDPENPEVVLPAEAIPDYILNPQMDMPEQDVDGIAYIGYLEIPALELNLPIISQTTYPNLRKAPCRYSGSAYLDDLVIGAHNYSSHFGGLGRLSQGDALTFTDMDGNVFHYRVADFEILQPYQVEELCSADWDLSLYTCTFGGQTRLTVRCEKADEI